MEFFKHKLKQLGLLHLMLIIKAPQEVNLGEIYTLMPQKNKEMRQIDSEDQQRQGQIKASLPLGALSIHLPLLLPPPLPQLVKVYLVWLAEC